MWNRFIRSKKIYVVDERGVVIFRFKKCLAPEAAAYTKLLRPDVRFRFVDHWNLTPAQRVAAKLLRFSTPAKCSAEGLTLKPKAVLHRCLVKARMGARTAGNSAQ